MSVRVLETNLLHVSDIVYWLDATSGEDADPADMYRIQHLLEVDLTMRPRDLRVLHRPGGMVLWRRPATEIIEGLASESERARAAGTTYGLRGVVSDPHGRYNPRRFDLTVGDAGGHGVPVYPSPLGARIGKGGGLVGQMVFDGTGASVPWAVLELEVEIGSGVTQRYRAQANASGSFRLAMDRLPPLAEGVTAYAAHLSVRADEAADPAAALDPDDLTARQLGSLTDADVFEDAIKLLVRPGMVIQVRTLADDHLVVKPNPV